LTRRASWLALGAALGAGGTIWARRRLELLSERLKSRQLSADIVTLAERGARAGASHLRRAVDDGRESARKREDRLWHELEVRAKGF
jgi:hypothetical protein